jgi:hypothetical protein
MTTPSITVVIPTLCESVRKTALLNAIESVHASSVSLIRVLLVVNGQRFDSDLLRELQGRTDIEVLQLDEGSLIKAHLEGRRAIGTEFFAYLDDDDVFLPGAMDTRLEVIQSTQCDLVVTSGFFNAQGAVRISLARMDKVNDDPLLELFHLSWLRSCNHLFRTATVPVSYFEDAQAYMEWTWLAFRLVHDGKKVIASPQTTFRINSTEGSLSKTPQFLHSRVVLYRRMLARKPSGEVALVIRDRLSSAWHAVAELELASGHKGSAFAAHLKSLVAHRRGLKYLTYTRHFLR